MRHYPNGTVVIKGDSGFHELYFTFQSPGFRISTSLMDTRLIPQAKISQIPESGFPYMEQN